MKKKVTITYEIDVPEDVSNDAIREAVNSMFFLGLGNLCMAADEDFDNDDTATILEKFDENLSEIDASMKSFIEDI